MSFLDPIGRLCRALLRLDSPGTPGPPGGSALQEAHLEQLTVMLQWFDDAERCALKGWPDLKADVHRTFELQRLFARPSILRLNYLRKCDPARLGAGEQPVRAISPDVRRIYRRRQGGGSRECQLWRAPKRDHAIVNDDAYANRWAVGGAAERPGVASPARRDLQEA